MIRRQFISDERGYSQQLSPRKVKPIRGNSLYQPTILYLRGSEHQPFEEGYPEWVGKILVPWNGENIQSYIRSRDLGKWNKKYLSEYEIARVSKFNTYRILYTDPLGKFIKSKPSAEYVPSRLNVIVRPDNVILDVKYF